MDQEQSQVGARVDDGDKSPEQIRREIDDARQELGDTAAALAAKTDVKARAKDKVEGVKQTLAEKKPDSASGATAQLQTKAQENPVAAAAIGAFVAGLLFGRITKR